MLEGMKLNDYVSAERGRLARLAERSGLSAAFLSQIANGVRPAPADRCTAIEKATDGVVGRKDLRPTDWRDIWPELAEAANDPAPEAA